MDMKRVGHLDAGPRTVEKNALHSFSHNKMVQEEQERFFFKKRTPFSLAATPVACLVLQGECCSSARVCGKSARNTASPKWDKSKEL